jgi:hypothetical protein
MALKSQYQVAVVNEDLVLNASSVTFAASTTTSSILFCGGTSPGGVILPASWLAGNLSFNVGKFPTGLVPMVNVDGTPFAVVTGAGAQWVPLQPVMFNGVIYIQAVSSVSQPAMSVDFSLIPLFSGIKN